MDFISRLPHSEKRCDSIWVIVDLLMKFVYFLARRSINNVGQLAKLSIKEIVRFHGVQCQLL